MTYPPETVAWLLRERRIAYDSTTCLFTGLIGGQASVDHLIRQLLVPADYVVEPSQFPGLRAPAAPPESVAETETYTVRLPAGWGVRSVRVVEDEVPGP